MNRVSSPTVRRRPSGSIQGWLWFALLVGAMCVLVVLFVRNLPDPPRYDELTIEPGSGIPPRPAFGLKIEVGEGASMVARSWRSSELEVEGTPAIPDILARSLRVGATWRLLAVLNVELSEPTVVGLLLEMNDVEVVVRSAVSEIASHRAEAPERHRVDDLLIPAGSRTLEFDIVPIGPDPLFRGSKSGGMRDPDSILTRFSRG